MESFAIALPANSNGSLFHKRPAVKGGHERWTGLQSQTLTEDCVIYNSAAFCSERHTTKTRVHSSEGGTDVKAFPGRPCFVEKGGARGEE